MPTIRSQLPPLGTPVTLDVIVPIYNEQATATQVVEAVLSLAIPGVHIRLTVVESNSTDGSREAMQAVSTHPRVNLILEDRPAGKGLAVRKGLAVTTGDIILIQDADLEYDITDYQRLIKPIIGGHADFVIGSRHTADSPMRQFDGQPRRARLMNVGHRWFTRLFNTTFGSALEDPFSMFKVFRRECILGMNFRARRFDFDWELAGKIIRRGFTPMEIPVRYESRSFDEGKKVRIFRDPVTWIWTCARCRLERPDWSPAHEWVERAEPVKPDETLPTTAQRA